MANKKILVPYNFTSFDDKALDFVVSTFLGQSNVDVTLFHAYAPLPQVKTGKNTTTEQLSSNMRFLSQRISEKENCLKDILRKLRQRGFPEANLHYVYEPRKKNVTSEIIDAAIRLNCKIVVLSHQPGKISRFFTGNVFNQVVRSLPNKTICIVS